jgi:hypothetical protein
VDKQPLSSTPYSGFMRLPYGERESPLLKPVRAILGLPVNEAGKKIAIPAHSSYSDSSARRVSEANPNASNRAIMSKYWGSQTYPINLCALLHKDEKRSFTLKDKVSKRSWFLR